MSSHDVAAGHDVEPSRRARSTATFLICGGVAVLLFAGYLYATGLSRAIAVWTSPLGASMLVAGARSQRTGRPTHRWLLVLIGVVAVALLVLGLVTLVYALQAVDTAV